MVDHVDYIGCFFDVKSSLQGVRHRFLHLRLPVLVARRNRADDPCPANSSGVSFWEDIVFTLLLGF